MSPAEKQAREMMADKKATEAATKAYDAASSTPAAPKSAASEPVKKMAKGGSASSRADGIAKRGKTRGKMC